ncbi:MAG: hypothetical protein GDA67_15540 [Nitrospira sp. CR1.3]|nr:hypothetical protein [Nitrospira sp. CR1.3]
MSKMQQLNLWNDDGSLNDVRLPTAPGDPPAPMKTPESITGPTPAELECSNSIALRDTPNQGNPLLDGPPLAPPLPDAVAAGVFGLTEDGPIQPDDEEVRAMTEEHARELLAVLADLEVAEEGLRTGEDPRTGKTPKTPESRAKLAEFLERESQRLKTAYGDALAAFVQGFGEDATATLDLWVRKSVAGCDTCLGRYDPGHPWHYYHEGDAAPPIPVEQIEGNLDVGHHIERDLPKNRTKRLQRMHELLEQERRRVEEDRARYEDIVQRGAEALSRYDREIAHTSDEMARATALSLKYNHIRLGLSRVAWLEKHLGLRGALLMPTKTA